MTTPAADIPAGRAATLADYLRLIRRRKWVVLVALVAAPAIAYAVTSRQPARYSASAQVLLLSSAPTTTAGVADASFLPNSPATQTTLARAAAVADLAVREAHLPLSPGAFLADTSVSFGPDGDVVTFTATTRDAALAPRVANAYAHAYLSYRYTSQTAGIENAIKTLSARLDRTQPGAMYEALTAQLRSLEAQEAVHLADARLFQLAGPAGAVDRQMVRDTALGAVLGLLVGLGLAFLLDALDTRVRSVDALEERLGLALLGRVPPPPRRLQKKSALSMLQAPEGSHAEVFRMLRTNLELAMLGRDIRTVMVTSAVEEEGKSTTIANLAVAFARVGREVTLVDLDLRRPFLHRFFETGGHPGLTEVVLGHASLEEALAPIDVLPEPPRRGRLATLHGHGHANGNGNGSGRLVRAPAPLRVLTLGSIPPDPGEFMGSQPLASLLDDLRRRGGLILIDAPPLFHVGDGLALSAHVDAAVVLTRMGVVRRHGLGRLRRLVESMPARKLGLVVTDVAGEDGYGYGYGYAASAYQSPVRALHG